MNEAGGKHYGNGLQPWDLQRDMQTWGSVFIDARRTDAIEYLFRTKGDKLKQLDDAKKAKHNCEVIIAELEKEEIQLELPVVSNCSIEHTLENAKYINYPFRTCLICGQIWPKLQLPPIFKTGIELDIPNES